MCWFFIEKLRWFYGDSTSIGNFSVYWHVRKEHALYIRIVYICWLQFLRIKFTEKHHQWPMRISIPNNFKIFSLWPPTGIHKLQNEMLPSTLFFFIQKERTHSHKQPNCLLVGLFAYRSRIRGPNKAVSIRKFLLRFPCSVETKLYAVIQQ